MHSDRYQYAAFISYSHTADRDFAPAIQSALHKLAKPWYKLRALNVYRDQTNLSISPELWPTIQQAISISEYFLLFASREAAKSKWVKRELSWWLENRSADHLFIILTDGDILWDNEQNDFDWSVTNALPDLLAGTFTEEPNYIDFRQFKSAETLNLRDPLFLDNILSIAAPLHGISKEKLGGEDVKQHRITRMITWAACLTIGTISVIAIWQAIVANQQRKAAVKQGSISLARQLAAQSELLRTNDFKNLPLAVALATEGLHITATAETDHAAWESLVLLPQLYLETEIWRVAKVKYSPHGAYLALAGQDSTARIFECATNKIIWTARHNSPVWDIDFSPDGAHIATAGGDGLIKVFDFKTNSLLQTYNHLAAVRKILFSSDGKYLGSASEDGTACLWDLVKKNKRSMIKHAKTVWSLAFSHDNRYLATASRDSTAILWDIEKNKLVHQLRHDAILWNVAFSINDRNILTTSDDKSARVWQTSNGALVKKLEHADRVIAANFSPDSNILITTSQDRTIKIWSMHNFQQLYTINTRGIILSLAFSPDSRYFVTGGDYTSVWSVATYKEVNRLYKEASIYSVDFSPNGEYIATADASRARVWKVNDHTRQAMETNDRIIGEGTPIMTKGWCAAMASDANRLLTGNEDGSARLWNLAAHKAPSTFNHGQPITAVAYASTVNFIATASDSVVKLWDAKTGMQDWQHSGLKGVVSLDIDNKGQYVAIGGDDGVVILEVGSGKQYFTQKTKDPVYFTAFNDDGRTLVMIDAGGGLTMLNVMDKTVRFTGQYNGLMSAGLSHDKKYVCLATETNMAVLAISGNDPGKTIIPVKNGLDIAASFNNQLAAICQSQDSTVHIVDLITKKERATFRHNAAVLTATFDSKGRHLATACHDGTIHIRNLETQTEVSSITWNSVDPIERICFSRDDRYIIAASQQYKTAAWLWQANDAIGLACRFSKFRFTEADWNMYMNSKPYQPLCR